MIDPNVFRLTSLPDTVALAPYLLGYHPHHSLVALGERRHRIVFAVASPLSEHDGWGMPADRIARVLAERGVESVLLIGYGPLDLVERAVTRTTDALRAAAIPVLAAARVDDGMLWHLHCDDPLCATPGLPFDPAATSVAAQATVAGMVALPDRAAIAATLAPVTGEQADAMAAAIDAAAFRIAGLVRGTRQGDRTLAARLQSMALRLAEEGINRSGTGGRLDDEQAALLLVLLALDPVHDAVAKRVGDDDAQIRTWADLTRRAGVTLAPGPATLLALAAIQAGNGVLADAAARRALDAEPGDGLAQALLDAVQLGIDPDTVRRMLHD